MFWNSSYQRVLRASTIIFGEDNGAATDTPPRGTTSTTGVSNFNLKNVDDSTTAYSASPITAGNNSFNKYTWALWSGSFNSVGTVLWSHMSGILPSNVSLFFYPSGTGFYTSPATTTDARLTHDLTATGNVTTGVTVKVGALGPQFTGKSATSFTSPCFSEYLVHQLRTTASASPGDVGYSGIIQWTEN